MIKQLYLFLCIPFHLSAHFSLKYFQNTGHIWKIPLPHHDELDITPSVSKRHVFYLNEFIYKTQPRLNVQLQTNIPKGLTVKLGYDATPVDMHVGVIYAAFVLFLLYVLIIYEVCDVSRCADCRPNTRDYLN